MPFGESGSPEPGPGANRTRLFDELMARWRARPDDTAAFVREAQAVLDRYEAEARDTADRLIVDARIEAARLLTDARREAATLTEKAAALRQALDGVIGRMPGTGASPQASATPAIEFRPPPTRWPVPRAARAASLEKTGIRQAPSAPPRAAATRARSAVPHRVVVALLGVIGLAAAGAAMWFGAGLFGPVPAVGTGTHDQAASRERLPGGGGPPRSQTASPDAPLTIVLEASRPSWVRATTDGRQERGYVLQPGQQRRITASKDVSVRAGDAGALMVSLNGGNAVRFGRDGQALTRHFGLPQTTRSASTPAARAVPAADAGAAPGRPGVGSAASSPSARAANAPATPRSPALEPPRSGVGPQSIAPAAPPAARPSGAAAENDRELILANDRQWFESFYRGDRAAMARVTAPGFEIVDSRDTAPKTWPGTSVERSLSDIRVDVHGDGAVLSARMVERAATGGQTRERESYISEVWIRRDGAWRLLGLRLASGEQVRRAADSLR